LGLGLGLGLGERHLLVCGRGLVIYGLTIYGTWRRLGGQQSEESVAG